MLRFLLQAIVVLGACRLIGWIGVKFLGQAQVVMEMVTGVMLGPSLFGLMLPQVQSLLFPPKIQVMQADGELHKVNHPSMMILYVIAQLGLVLYMFLIGQEFNISLISSRVKGAISVSLAGILAPFTLGAVIAATILNTREDIFAPGIPFAAEVLYLGAAMSITAFPMLARILFESGLAGTSMGTLALGAGASDDAAAWSLLAVVLALSKGQPNYIWMAIGGGILFAVIILKIGKRLFVRLGEQVDREGKMSNGVFVFSMLFLLAGAYITDAVGIYAVFGAFLIGAAMPRGKFADIMREKLEYVTVGVLLPFFFVYSGLNTKLSLLNSPALWGLAILILLAAIIGKGVACAVAARLSGEPWRESAAIGTLMNSRGLMELIILNIGLQQKVITETLFTMMMLMAIVTTLMTAPIFKWIYGKRLAEMKSNLVPV
jgi:Kef-type K+ transport system membrane component KefB